MQQSARGRRGSGLGQDAGGPVLSVSANRGMGSGGSSSGSSVDSGRTDPDRNSAGFYTCMHRGVFPKIRFRWRPRKDLDLHRAGCGPGALSIELRGHPEAPGITSPWRSCVGHTLQHIAASRKLISLLLLDCIDLHENACVENMVLLWIPGDNRPSRS